MSQVANWLPEPESATICSILYVGRSSFTSGALAEEIGGGLDAGKGLAAERLRIVPLRARLLGVAVNDHWADQPQRDGSPARPGHLWSATVILGQHRFPSDGLETA